MIHHRGLKTVKPSRLLEASDVMEKGDQFCQAAVFLAKLHPSAYLRGTADHSFCVHDLQSDFLIFPAELVQIFFERSPGMCQIYHKLFPFCCLLVLLFL